MYNSLKKILKRIVPKRFLFKNELVFRRFYGLFYRGKQFQCNVCSNNLSTFVNYNDRDLICPFCGSLSRNRRLWHLLETNDAIKGNVLHFSPSRNIYRKLKSNASVHYYSSDFENQFIADYNFDITNISCEDQKFDTIICYHILEHIIDDKKAMSEIYRVLKPNGKAFIQTPFKEGAIYEDYSITTEEARKEHFGQEDHVRVYSVNGLVKRLEDVGFKVDILTFENSSESTRNGFKPETVLVISKP
ncbi:class I SAM-dependent methyltransferase [Flavobacteriaceae bacterium 144Ye]|nr:class I SAM-dependent methyltransferase [Flavobacteriaceae bacterium 144Ye]